MDARFSRPWMGVAIFALSTIGTIANGQFLQRRDFVAHSQNFVVFASSPAWAAQVAEAAEANRRELAMHWLGQELPAWSQRCPIHVQSGPQLGAGGETRFTLLPGGVGNWMMSVQGTQERVLDSVLPHEITHTIFATHFAKFGDYVPRWADEGACTTVEHISEKKKHAHFLQKFLRSGRGLSFNKMFSLKEYPHDILPLYAQGHSAVQFLIDQGGPRKFVRFLETGMETRDWEHALSINYGYDTIGHYQSLWNQWLRDGSPSDLADYSPGLSSPATALVAATPSDASELSNSKLDGKVQFAIGNNQPAPITLAGGPARPTDWALNAPLGSPGNESWYKRRFREISGNGTTTRLADAEHPATVPVQSQSDNPNRQPSALPPRQSQATARPRPSQHPGIRVLDWGGSPPVPGIQAGNSWGVPPAAAQSTQPAYRGDLYPGGTVAPGIQMVPVYR